MEWKTFPMWRGRTVYILGGGPSLNSIDIDRLRGERVIAVNNAFKLAPFADICYFKDFHWFQQEGNGDNLQEFGGLTVTSCSKFRLSSWVRFLQMGDRNVVELRPERICHGSNAGFESVNLAIKLEPDRVVLLGFDMQEINGRSNYHDEHNRKVPPHIYEHQFIPSFKAIKNHIENRNIEIINATPGSALTIFPIVEPEEIYP